MAHLFDSNCFLRLAEPNSLHRAAVLAALRKLRGANEAMYYTPQVLVEFWNVCTRPATARGGIGLTVEQTERKVRLIEKHFRLLSDSLATFIEWRRLVSDFNVVGVQVHDAKIVASLIVHNISHLVTFNEKDFKRYPMINVVNPYNV